MCMVLAKGLLAISWFSKASRILQLLEYLKALCCRTQFSMDNKRSAFSLSPGAICEINEPAPLIMSRSLRRYKPFLVTAMCHLYIVYAPAELFLTHTISSAQMHTTQSQCLLIGVKPHTSELNGNFCLICVCLSVLSCTSYMYMLRPTMLCIHLV